MLLIEDNFGELFAVSITSRPSNRRKSSGSMIHRDDWTQS